MYSTSEYSNCEAFNGCTRLDAQGDCNGADGCTWTEQTRDEDAYYAIDDTAGTDDSGGGFCDCKLTEMRTHVPPRGLC